MKVKILVASCKRAFLVFHVGLGDQNHKPFIDHGHQSSFCLRQPFGELCNEGSVINSEWILRVSSSSSTCNVIYTAISNSRTPEEQTISIDNCQTIYDCWLVFENESVCLYHHMSPGIPSEPNEQLYLVSMTVQEGNWVLLPYPESVFTHGQYAGTISSSVGLYGTFDVESDSKAAVFLIGKGQNVHRVKLLFPPAPVERRFTKVCDWYHRMISVSTTNHDVLIICDNKMYWIEIGRWWKPVEVTPPELTEVTFTGTSVNCYISESSGTSVGLITLNNAGNTEYCFVNPSSQHTISHCGVISNVSLSLGLLVRINISDTRFLAFFDGDVGVISISSNGSYETIGVDFCNAQNNCLLIPTGNRIYIGNEQKTVVLDRETLGVITTHNDSVSEVLLMMESVARQPSPTNALTSTAVSNNSATIHTTTSTVSTVSTSSTSALVSVNASTSMTGDISSGDATTPKIIMHTSVKSVNVNITADPTTGTISKPSKTSMIESPPAVDDAIYNNTANHSDIDAKSEFGILHIFIGISLVLGLFIFILLLVIITIVLIARCYQKKLRFFKTDHREKIEMRCHIGQGQKLSQTDVARSVSDSGRPGGEVVMSPTDIDMYELTSPDTSTTVTNLQ